MGFSHSPLRYPGGKSFLLNFFIKTLELNGLDKPIYVEPYSGGAGIAIGLLVKNIADSVIINDADERIYYFWISLLRHYDDFIKLIENTDVDISSWVKQKEIYKNFHQYSQLEVGFSTFFLNRCNRSGILDANPIGGKLQSGRWKITARFNKTNLIKRIERIYKKKSRIKVYNLDAINLIKKLVNNSNINKEKMFIYLDPPYYEKGSMLYYNYYCDDDHRRLAMFMQGDKVFKWIMTYDNSNEIIKLYCNMAKKIYDLTYFVHTAKKSTEILIHDVELKLPLLDRK